jgi:hypothetical protein
MRLSFDEGWRHASNSGIINVGCDLLGQFKFSKGMNHSANHMLRKVAEYCLVGEKGAATARRIWQNLKEAVSKFEAYAFDHEELLKALILTQPLAALEALCGNSEADLKLGIRILGEAGRLRMTALDAIPEMDLVKWCDQQPETRYPAAAAAVTPFLPSGSAGRSQWTSTALKLLDKAPNRVEVLKQFIERFSPMGWAGSHGTIVESNVMLLAELTSIADPALVEFITKEKVRLAAAVKVERQMETIFERERDERFE